MAAGGQGAQRARHGGHGVVGPEDAGTGTPWTGTASIGRSREVNGPDSTISVDRAPVSATAASHQN